VVTRDPPNMAIYIFQIYISLRYVINLGQFVMVLRRYLYHSGCKVNVISNLCYVDTNFGTKALNVPKCSQLHFSRLTPISVG
jgi:hypothetical protein